MKKYGLIGYPLAHSFSKKYFTQKFEKERIDAAYNLFELKQINDFKRLISQHKISGLNVTIPYKEKIIPYLNELDETAKEIGAVNVIRFLDVKGEVFLKGYNTDTIGFRQSIKPFLTNTHKSALILGSGGASKAIRHALAGLGIATQVVSRTACNAFISYADLNEKNISEHQVIVNTTPLGMEPNIGTFPDIPYQFLTPKHLLFDAVYNPKVTLFMKKGIEQGATCVNGEKMLIEQAEAAWNIWNQT